MRKQTMIEKETHSSTAFLYWEIWTDGLVAPLRYIKIKIKTSIRLTGWISTCNLVILFKQSGGSARLPLPSFLYSLISVTVFQRPLNKSLQLTPLSFPHFGIIPRLGFGACIHESFRIWRIWDKGMGPDVRVPAVTMCSNQMKFCRSASSNQRRTIWSSSNHLRNTIISSCALCDLKRFENLTFASVESRM